ncbi:unnamed protein product [Vitrella brassicaformis CCMP3155]|uniref:Acyl carrier protein n=2 Tax=Vitrella brassicaformis TaxID=1169539 RepID=A0A0G4FH46_VITBC|nr:unnamed protein product [Vitrella brassicaformis CCMP3155]|mmetsp:Transcript_53232/g.134021  ORF Transcript_53232/g.134021 Transcript_53232/m.134021 type:complete len:133 (+) Transcript_53232:83-481(+)|eukprot:CEM12831.1 unnamed protein product [Vitrella brassicaformis CCMP3155]
MMFRRTALFGAVLAALVTLSSAFVAPAPSVVLRGGLRYRPATHQSLLVLRAEPEVLERVKDLVAEQLGVDKEKVTDSANFVQDLGADSLDSVELVMAFEEKFGIEIPDEEATNIVTVADAVSYIEKNQSTSA